MSPWDWPWARALMLVASFPSGVLAQQSQVSLSVAPLRRGELKPNRVDRIHTKQLTSQVEQPGPVAPGDGGAFGERIVNAREERHRILQVPVRAAGVRLVGGGLEDERPECAGNTEASCKPRCDFEMGVDRSVECSRAAVNLYHLVAAQRGESTW